MIVIYDRQNIFIVQATDVISHYPLLLAMVKKPTEVHTDNGLPLVE